MEAWQYLPNPWREAIENLPRDYFATLEEIRFRIHRPVYLYGPGGCRALLQEPVSPQQLEQVLWVLADHSMYARGDELRQGFLTLKGGHRVGIAGRAVVEDGRVTTLTQISGLNIRIARAVQGPGRALWERLQAAGIELGGVLLVSPPRAGKTTLLRDLVRVLSDQGRRVVVVDERSEIAGLGGAGISGHDLGLHTDVLDGWPKVQGIEVAIRTLGPDLVAVDELGGPKDLEAVWKARHSGVGVLATMHGDSRQDLLVRSEFRQVLLEGAFDAVLTLSANPAPGTVREVWFPDGAA